MVQPNSTSPEIQQLISKRDLLTKDEERILLRRAKDGDEDARDELITRNLGLVAKNARYYMNYTTIPFEDLFQEGVFGLFAAINKFDLDKEWRLSTYATWWIRHYIGRHMTNCGRTVKIPSRIIDLKRDYVNAREDFMKEFGTEPTNEEMSAILNVSVEKIEEALLMSAPISSLDYSVKDSKGSNIGGEVGTLGELIPDASVDTETTIMRDETLTRLAEAISGLEPIEQAVITRFFQLDGAEKRPTKTELVAEFKLPNMNKFNIILNDGVRKLREKLADLAEIDFDDVFT